MKNNIATVYNEDNEKNDIMVQLKQYNENQIQQVQCYYPYIMQGI